VLPGQAREGDVDINDAHRMRLIVQGAFAAGLRSLLAFFTDGAFISRRALRSIFPREAVHSLVTPDAIHPLFATDPVNALVAACPLNAQRAYGVFPSFLGRNVPLAQGEQRAFTPCHAIRHARSPW
jgi:hypothetical protein